ncbi:MAG: membrane protein insertion efficiency factor YidD [Elusimicrobiota bacterium]
MGPGACRFQPSCSDYAFQALDKHGILKGTRLAAGRLFRCRPFSPGGYDPAP